MADPDWNRGFYYDGVPPHNGMKLARREYSSVYQATPLMYGRDRDHHLQIRAGVGAAIRSAHVVGERGRHP